MFFGGGFPAGSILAPAETPAVNRVPVISGSTIQRRERVAVYSFSARAHSGSRTRAHWPRVKAVTSEGIVESQPVLDNVGVLPSNRPDVFDGGPRPEKKHSQGPPKASF